MKAFVVAILLLFSCNFLLAQPQGHNDSSNFVLRSFSDSALKEFKNDRDFQYSVTTEPTAGLWERFWKWFWWKVSEIMRTKRGRTTVWTILIATGATAIIFFIIKVTGMNNGGLFSKNAKNDLDYTTETEDINRISFDEAIKEAVSNRNFRMATRLLYLQSLKQLSDKGYIQWNFNKSNSDYIKEVAGNPWQSLFKKLTYSFEYAWYGEIDLATNEFNNLEAQFQQFNKQL